jgi:hypothetical protein
MGLTFDDAGAMLRPQGWSGPSVRRNLLARSRSISMLNRKPGAVSRPGTVFEFQFPQ